MNQPATNHQTRPPLHLDIVVEELLKKLPREYREELLSQMASATKALDRVRNELTTYYMSLSSQAALEANGLDLLRHQIVASQSLLFAMSAHGDRFAKGNHPLMTPAKTEEAGPLDM